MTIRSSLTAHRRESMSVRNRAGRRYWLVAWSLLVFALGCASSGQHYTAKTVPASLIATKRENAQTLDLTRLARASKDSDSIDRGDVIEVSISAGLDEDDTITLPVRINDEGIANLPELGPIRLAGMEMEAAEAAIVAMCIENKLYVRPNVTVTMKRQRMNRVMVVGAVKSPDVYELPRGRSDLLAAIVAAGGLEKDAGTKVEIRNPRRPGGRSTPIASGLQPGIDTVGHSSGDLSGTTLASTDPDIIPVIDADGKMESYKVDLVSATKAGKGGYIIEDGGVISIEKRDPEPLHVLGLVRKPDRYDFPIAEELRVTDAIALAGGTSMPVADKVFIVRRVPKSNETAVIQVSLREAKRNAQANMSLEPGDVVSVENTPTTVLYEAINIVKFNLSAGATLGSGFF